MDEQQVFNIAVGLISGVGGWLFRVVWQRQDESEKQHKELTDKITNLRVDVSGDYVTRSELASNIGNMTAVLRRIEDKLDRKQDK